MANMANLFDSSKCTACRGCQVACKNWNRLPAVIEPFKGSYQTKESTDADTYTIVKMNEYEHPVDGIQWKFAKFQCICTAWSRNA
jgi:formate dehydrogenase iron-sulfur subunit